MSEIVSLFILLVLSIIGIIRLATIMWEHDYPTEARAYKAKKNQKHNDYYYYD